MAAAPAGLRAAAAPVGLRATHQTDTARRPPRGGEPWCDNDVVLRTYRDRAIVLRTYKLGEADRILVLLGRSSGQIRAVAKGVRRTSSKFGARLSSFNLVDIQCHRGPGLHTVTQAETVSAYSDSLAADYSAFTNAKLLVEAAQKISEGNEDPVPEQFDLLHGALHSLASSSHPPTLVGAAYLLRAVGLEGWSPTLTSCVLCGEDQGLTYFSTSQGGAVCEVCGPASGVRVDPELLTLMDALMSGDWDTAEATSPHLWEEAQTLAGHWTQWHLEQKLRSLPFATSGSF